MLFEYQKIDTVFNRDVKGTKKLIEGSFRKREVEFVKDLSWCFTEKVDGTNIRVYWDGHKVSFHGRTDRAIIPAHLLEYLTATFSSIETEELFEQMFGEKEVIFFGEGYGPKIQKGHLYRDAVSFIMFDIAVNGVYLSRENMEEIAKAFSIPVVPIIFYGNLDAAINFVKTRPASTMGTAPMEGLVGKPSVDLYTNTGSRIIVKIKVCDF